MKKWISIGDYIINPDYFNIFYIEQIPDGKYIIFGEDKNGICWKLNEYNLYEMAKNALEFIFESFESMGR